ncbi:endonuclease/exonuclease/phosphatase family protein [Abyssibius alkaniclasticus]|uniref:endonuclease/exonuclease/phosphatase family protein n=1 Tax=Abyssibius alkaniclasticus TaxID=2881234 RepID=UPI002363AE25|nr:endonuclease/exonuclease/phosphatase family protein [Abyssibius alkaniclasticus]UPH69916.1 endonuclease/exonuclease/phosphatase family protein [Abyssibius alkaniclasticus]
MRQKLLGLVLCALAAPLQAETLSIMSFNIFGGGASDGKPVDETLAVIRAMDPDIVGLQETRLISEICEAEYCPADGASAAAVLAAELGYYYYEQTQENVALWSNAVISRYPIIGQSNNDLGVQIDVNGTEIWLFNIQLDDEPYQPYQALGIEYGPAPFVNTEPELIKWATRTRSPALDLLFADFTKPGDAIIIITGDFGEPSALDWTEATVEAGLHPLAVQWPTTQRLADAGFVDAYRAIWPDPLEKPAFTWTPRWTTEDDPEDHHDRIDYIFVRGATDRPVTVREAAIVGEPGIRSDIIIEPWPSDHRAVFAIVEF